jgi:hypothetical protein
LNFGEIPNLTLNNVVLIIKKKQEEEADDASFGYYSLSSLFYPKETVWVSTFHVHLMLHFSIKSNKHARKWSPVISLQPHVNSSG